MATNIANLAIALGMLTGLLLMLGTPVLIMGLLFRTLWVDCRTWYGRVGVVVGFVVATVVFVVVALIEISN